MQKFLKHEKVFINRPDFISLEVSNNKNKVLGTIMTVGKDRTCLVSTFTNPKGSWEHIKWLKKSI